MSGRTEGGDAGHKNHSVIVSRHKPVARLTAPSIPGNVLPMLDGCPLIAFVSATDAGRARHFFQEILGLRLVSESPFALQFDCAGTMLRVALAKSVAPASYTVLGWQVTDIEQTVQSLGNAGIGLEIFEGMGQSEQGIWNAPSGARVAWFRDPDGNLLSVSEF
jgi:catechol 2,3-dioxygenase-like lactoylglutathione lyase family enzyme